MVKQVQLIDEYYDDEDDDELLFVPPSYYESDEQLVLFACLLLLKQLYEQLQPMSPQEIMEEVDDLLDTFESDFIKTATGQIDSVVWDSLREELVEWNIPVFGNYVVQDSSMIPIMEDSIKSTVNQLRYDLKAKTRFFVDNMTKDLFSIVTNIKRAMRGLIDAVGNNLGYSKEKTHRNVLNFVYGNDKLYAWRSAHLSTTCDWCLAQEKRPPRLLKDWELDHPHGHCELVPIDETFSKEYYALLSDMGELDAPSGDNEFIVNTVRRNYDNYF